MYNVETDDLDLPQDKEITVLVISGTMYGFSLKAAIESTYPKATVVFSSTPIKGEFDYVFNDTGLPQEDFAHFNYPVLSDVDRLTFFPATSNGVFLVNSDHQLLKLLESLLLHLHTQGVFTLTAEQINLINTRRSSRADLGVAEQYVP